jgi:signal peptidase II
LPKETDLENNENASSMHERKKISKAKMMTVSGLIIVIAVLVDQLTKYKALTGLKDQTSFVIIDNVLEFYYIVNTGSSWGMLAGQKVLILFISAVIIALCLFLIIKSPDDVKFIPFNISLSMIIAGGIGNGIDRIRFSYVIDFIYFKLINFPVFNVADIFVTCGAFLFVVLILFKYKEKDLYFMKFNQKKFREMS